MQAAALLSRRPPAKLDGDVFPLHVTKLTQALTESLDAIRVGGRGKPEKKSDVGYFVELLRLSGRQFDPAVVEAFARLG